MLLSLKTRKKTAGLDQLHSTSTSAKRGTADVLKNALRNDPAQPSPAHPKRNPNAANPPLVRLPFHDIVMQGGIVLERFGRAEARYKGAFAVSANGVVLFVDAGICLFNISHNFNVVVLVAFLCLCPSQIPSLERRNRQQVISVPIHQSSNTPHQPSARNTYESEEAEGKKQTNFIPKTHQFNTYHLPGKYDVLLIVAHRSSGIYTSSAIFFAVLYYFSRHLRNSFFFAAKPEKCPQFLISRFMGVRKTFS